MKLTLCYHNPTATYPASRFSPPLTHPQKFRSSQIEACDHSECFLFSYDLHRRFPTHQRPPRIYMNPKVKVAYDENWWRWQTRVLRQPVVRWWLGELQLPILVNISSWLVFSFALLADILLPSNYLPNTLLPHCESLNPAFIPYPILVNWSRGIPFWMVDWIWEAFARRRRDYCTWAGLNIPDRCPALPGVLDRPWSADSA
jgi:hypothetical protein